MKSVQRSAFSVQRSAFSVQRSAFSVQRSAFSVQRSAFSVQRSAFSVLSHKAKKQKGEVDKACFGYAQQTQSGLSSIVCGLNHRPWSAVYRPKWRLLFLPLLISQLSYLISTPKAVAQLNLSSCGCPADLPAGAGSFTGKTCFDIALSNDNTNSCGPLTARIGTKADFTQAATNTQIYTYTPSGTVSKVRFSYEDIGNVAIQSITPASTAYKTALNLNTPCTVTVVYKNNLNTTALGLTAATAIKPKLYVVYNNNGNGLGSDVKLELTAQIKDCACCGAPTNTGGWLDFMCYNLGAENSGLDPFTYQGGAINGDLYQWGRLKDGHEIRTSPTTSTLSTTDVPGHGSFIPSPAMSGANYDWRSPKNDALWGATKTARDPCPVGYKIPSQTQWASIHTGITANWVWTGNGYKVGDNLYLPSAGERSVLDGSMNGGGYYWSSTVSGTNCFSLMFSSGTIMPNNIAYRASGSSIRCVAE